MPFLPSTKYVLALSAWWACDVVKCIILPQILANPGEQSSTKKRGQERGSGSDDPTLRVTKYQQQQVPWELGLVSRPYLG